MSADSEIIGLKNQNSNFQDVSVGKSTGHRSLMAFPKFDQWPRAFQRVQVTIGQGQYMSKIYTEAMLL